MSEAAPEKEQNKSLLPLENEINNALSKEIDWNRLKTEKLEASRNDALRKFRTELMGGQVTIDINQLKLDMNIDAHLKNRLIKSSSNIGDNFQEQKHFLKCFFAETQVIFCVKNRVLNNGCPLVHVCTL